MDPAVNLLFDRMRKETDSLKARLEETQNELSAWKFTPDRCGIKKSSPEYHVLLLPAR